MSIPWPTPCAPTRVSPSSWPRLDSTSPVRQNSLHPRKPCRKGSTPPPRFELRPSAIRNGWLQTHAQRDSAIDGIHAQRGEEVPVRFTAGWIGEYAQAERVRRPHKGRAAARLLLLRRPEEVHLSAHNSNARSHPRCQELLCRGIAWQTKYRTNLGPGKPQRVFLVDNSHRQSSDGLNLRRGQQLQTRNVQLARYLRSRLGRQKEQSR